MPAAAPRQLDPAADAALTWAGQLVGKVETMPYAELQAAWKGEEGEAHRAALKTYFPAILSQLIGHVSERIAKEKRQ